MSHDERSLYGTGGAGGGGLPAQHRQVSAVLRICSERSIPVTPRGAGNGPRGRRRTRRGRRSAEHREDERRTGIDETNLYADVQPGLRLSELCEAAAARSLRYYCPDPGERSATVGGERRHQRRRTLRGQIRLHA